MKEEKEKGEEEVDTDTGKKPLWRKTTVLLSPGESEKGGGGGKLRREA